MESDFPASGEVRRLTLSTSVVEIEATPNDAVVRISGELDMADADQVGELLAEAVNAGKPIVRVELTQLTFADSSAIKAILLGATTADERGVAYQLVNPHPSVQRLLEVTGLTGALTVVEAAEVQEGPNSL